MYSYHFFLISAGATLTSVINHCFLVSRADYVLFGTLHAVLRARFIEFI